MANNDLGAELAAMQEIAEALQQLDPLTRTRVLRWVIERFQGGVALAAAPAVAAVTALTELRAVPSPSAAGDESLSVSTLTDFFDPRGPRPSAEPAAQSVSGMLHEFVAEFQDLAREWHDEDAPGHEARAKPAFPVAS